MPPLFSIVAHLSVVLIVLLASDDVIPGVHCLQAAGPAAIRTTTAAAAKSIHARRIAATTITTTTISSTAFSASRTPFFIRSSLFAISSGESSSRSSSSALTNPNSNNYGSMTTLPRHPTNHDANEILSRAETALQIMHEEVIASYASSASSLDGIISDDDDIVMLSQFDANANVGEETEEDDDDDDCNLKNLLTNNESVYANSYVDLGKVDTVGFDFDYTLVTYTTELLSLIYDMSLKRLVQEKEYPREMLTAGLKFDPFFSIRGED